MTHKALLVLVVMVALLVVGVVTAAGVLVWEIRFRRPPVVNGELAFATVERARSPGPLADFFPRQAPGLLVLTRSQDLPSVQAYIRKTALDGLRALDWDENFAIVVFRGYQPETISNFEIVRIVRQDAEVGIYASTGFVDEEDIPTSPYHIVAVRKVGQWGANVTFRLYLDGTGEVALIATEVPESSLPLWPR